MTWVEIGLALMERLRDVFTMFAVISGILSAITAVVAACFYAEGRSYLGYADTEYGKRKTREADAVVGLCRRIFKYSLPVFILAALLSCVPSAKDLWEVRVALVKLELASSDNVKLGVEHIDKIARGLECKYLGASCPAPEKKEDAR